jgi:hypothetical protein
MLRRTLLIFALATIGTEGFGQTGPVFPKGVSAQYAAETPGQARMHTCLDQFNANKATNANGGLQWVQREGGYYSECNRRLGGSGAPAAPPTSPTPGTPCQRYPNLC